MGWFSSIITFFPFGAKAKIAEKFQNFLQVLADSCRFSQVLAGSRRFSQVLVGSRRCKTSHKKRQIASRDLLR